MPFYDPDAHLLFLSGKGDGNIRVYEVDHNKLYPTANTQYSSIVSAKVCDGKQEWVVGYVFDAQERCGCHEVWDWSFVQAHFQW